MRLDPTGLRAVISFGIAGGLDPSLHPGDVVVATAVIAETGAWKVPASVVTAVVERVRASGVGVVQGALAGVEEPILLPIDKAAVHRETEAIAVDMESHIGAAYAAANDLPFAAIRVISAPAPEGCRDADPRRRGRRQGLCRITPLSQFS